MPNEVKSDHDGKFLPGVSGEFGYPAPLSAARRRGRLAVLVRGGSVCCHPLLLNQRRHLKLLITLCSPRAGTHPQRWIVVNRWLLVG
jgi:hypothetical protein